MSNDEAAAVKEQISFLQDDIEIQRGIIDDPGASRDEIYSAKHTLWREETELKKLQKLAK